MKFGVELGIDIYKVGMVWPLETEGARAFLRGKDEVLVVEEKRGIIESELKEALYDYQSDKPSRMVGKYDEAGVALIPWTGSCRPEYWRLLWQPVSFTSFRTSISMPNWRTWHPLRYPSMRPPM